MRNQMEGAFIKGLNAAIYNDVKISGGPSLSSHFHQLPWIKMNEIPSNFGLAIIENEYPPIGMGEPPTAPSASARTNAMFAATGKRQCKLPISMES